VVCEGLMRELIFSKRVDLSGFCFQIVSNESYDFYVQSCPEFTLKHFCIMLYCLILVFVRQQSLHLIDGETEAQILNCFLQYLTEKAR
jgi:hypothetical protein